MRILTALILPLLCTCAPLFAQTPARWALAEELRIGTIDGPAALTRVHSAILSHDRTTLFVGQPQEGLIRAFDTTTGRLLRTFGRKGSGPGEFQSMGRLTLRGDTLVIVDWVLQHAVFYSPAGQHLETVRMPPAPIPGGPALALFSEFLSDGSGIGVPRYGLGPADPEAPPLPWIKMSADGRYLRTLGERDRRNASGLLQVGERVILFAQPMSERSRLHVEPNGASLVLVHAPGTDRPDARFTVTRMAAAGDTVYHRTYRYTPRPIPRALADSLYEVFADHFAGAPRALVRGRVREGVILPPMLPPVSDVVHVSDGSTWLRREEGLGPAARWLVLDPAGAIRATVSTPSGMKLLLVAGDRVWGLVRDALDVSYLVRYRVEQESGK